MRVVLGLAAAVLAVASVELPGEIAPQPFGLAIRAKGAEPGIGALEEQPLAGFQRAATEELQRAFAGGQVHAEGVVGVLRRDEEIVGDQAAATVAETERFGRALGGGLAPGIGNRGEQFRAGGEFPAGAGEQVKALVGGSQIVVVRAVVVEAVGGGESVKVAGRRIGRIEIRNVGSAVVEHAIVEGDAGAASEVGPEDEAALRRERGTEGARHVATAGTGVGKGRTLPRGGIDSALVAPACADHQVSARPVNAPLQADFG